MVSHLLDTNVVSELRKSQARADPGVRTWAAGQDPSSLAISVVTVMEIEIGVSRMERRDPRQGAVLRAWLERALLPAFVDRILPINVDVARHAASMHVPDPRPERDVLICATAVEAGLTIVTRNVADFEPLGAHVLNPWQH